VLVTTSAASEAAILHCQLHWLRGIRIRDRAQTGWRKRKKSGDEHKPSTWLPRKAGTFRQNSTLASAPMATPQSRHDGPTSSRLACSSRCERVG